MADLDAELLALAGEDSSDDERPRQRTQEGASGGERDGSPDDDADRIATTPRRAKRAPPRRTARRAGSDEDGEASSVSDNEPIPMDESEDERLSLAGDTSDTIFPVDNKFYSEQDKTEILAKPEVEREEILAERAQILERKRQDNQLRRLYKSNKQDGTMPVRKRAADSAGIEGGERKSTRQRKNLGGRNVGEVSSSLEAYKEQRAKRGERKAAAPDARKARRSESASDPDADGESEVEWDSGKVKQDSTSQFEEAPNLKDFDRLRVGRFDLAQYCFYPTFEPTVKNCYVRVSVAPEKDGTMNYRMAKIEGIRSGGQPYAAEKKQGAPFKCDKYVIASVGKNKREYPFIFCSTGHLSERELAQYKSVCANEQVAMPKKSWMAAKCDEIDKMCNYSFTAQELNEKLKAAGVEEEREKRREKIILIGKRNDAEREGNKDAMAVIDAQIRELEGPTKLAFGTSLYKAPPPKTKKSEGERLAEINRANRKANTENVRRAQIAERKAAAEHRAKVERGEATVDPFARVKILPKMHFDVRAAAAGKAQGPMTEAEIARRMAEEKEREDAAEREQNKIPEKLERMMSGEAEPEPGKIDFRKWDIMWQFGRLSRKKGGRESVYGRKLFDMEVIGSYDVGVKVDLDF